MTESRRTAGRSQLAGFPASDYLQVTRFGLAAPKAVIHKLGNAGELGSVLVAQPGEADANAERGTVRIAPNHAPHCDDR